MLKLLLTLFQLLPDAIVPLPFCLFTFRISWVSVKCFLIISLTVQINSFKLNIVIILRVIYPLIYIYIKKLFIVNCIKITDWESGFSASVLNFLGSFKIFPEQSKVRRTFSFWLADSVNNGLIRRADCGTYLLVHLTQTLSKILWTLLSRIDAGKKIKIFVCEIIDFQISISVCNVWKL